MIDRDRISRLEALLARVKARTDEPRTESSNEPIDQPGVDLAPTSDAANDAPNGVAHDPSNGELLPRHREDFETTQTMEERVAEQTLSLDRPDSVFPPESSTLHALPPPPPGSSASAFLARPASRPASKPASPSNEPPTSLEEAFEQYELVQEVVEILPDAEDDAVHLSVRPPILLDEVIEEEAAAVVRAQELSYAVFANDSPLVEELQSQQRLVVAPSQRPGSDVYNGELEVLGEADLEEVMDSHASLVVQTADEDDLDARPTRSAADIIATILATGIEPPPENANRPVLELQDDEEIDEPPPSSRRPVSHELAAVGTHHEAQEQELIFDDDPPPPLMTPPPESGRQVALPDLSPDSSSAFEASFSGSGEGRLDDGSLGPSMLRADLAENSGVAVVVAPSSFAEAETFGELIDLALSI